MRDLFLDIFKVGALSVVVGLIPLRNLWWDVEDVGITIHYNITTMYNFICTYDLVQKR